MESAFGFPIACQGLCQWTILVARFSARDRTLMGRPKIGTCPAPGASLSRSLVVRRNGAPMFRQSFLVLVLSLATVCIGPGAGAEVEEFAGLGALPAVEFKALSQLDWNPLGARALAIG